MQILQSDRKVDVLHVSNSRALRGNTTLRRPAWGGRAIAVFVALLLFVALVRLLTVDCWPRFQLRADVLSGVVIIVVLIITLIWAAMSDGDSQRIATVVASAGAAAHFAQGLPLVSALALAGVVRLPRTPQLRRLAVALGVAAVFLVYGVPLQMQRFVQSADFVCH